MKLVILLTTLAVAALSSALPAENVTERQEPKLEWWQNGIFYQIYPRSFKDSDGDGVGDIQGVIQKLDHLKELGVSGAWLSPIFKSPMADFGYDIADFYDVDPTFGTIADVEELFRKGKELGIKIILDFVPNHSSDESEWFKKSVRRIEPYTNYYVWHDGKRDATGQRRPPNNWQSIFYGSAWTWNEQRQQYYYHQFAKEQPDLNYRNPKVVEEMKNVLRFWLNKGVGGFRIDAVNHLFEVEDLRDEPLSGFTNDPKSYAYTHHDYTKDLDEMFDMVYQWRQLVDEFHKANGGDTPILMTEAYANTTFVMKFYNSRNNERQGSHMPFNFVLITDLNQYSSAADFKRVVDERLKALPEGKRLNWVIGNHDQPRVGSRYGENRIDGMLALVMTLPGIAVTYNGEEIGMLDNRDGISYKETVDPQACNLNETDNWKELSRDPQRTPFQWDGTQWAGFSQGQKKPWLPIHPNYKDINLSLQKHFKRSTFKFYKELVKLRQEHTFIHGDFVSKVINDNVFAYTRTFKGHDTYVILLNFGPREEIVDITQITTDFGDNSEVVVAGADTTYNTGDKLPTKSVYLRKYNTLILKSAKSSSATSITVSCVILVLSCLLGLFF